MNRQNLETIALIALYTIVAVYFVACLFQTIENLELIGASMLAFKPSFSVDSLVSKTRKYGESDKARYFGGLHTPVYRVLNHMSKALLDRGLYGVCLTMMSRSQHKTISYKSLFSVTISHGYSSVTIGARTIFAVDEWTRTIYHIDATGRLAVTDYYQDYDMTDVISQVSECVDVLGDYYTPERLKAIETKRRSHNWSLSNTENIGTVNNQWKRATVQCYFLRYSTKSVDWRKQWVRTSPTGSTEWKITTGSHHSAYQVVIGNKAYWLPHSILSREWELHGGRTFKSDHSEDYFVFNGNKVTIDLPLWWLEKTVGVEWRDNVAPIGRVAFLRNHVNKRKRRWNR